MSWSLSAAPKVKRHPATAVATAFSLIRAISVPLGLADPNKAEHCCDDLAVGVRYRCRALLFSKSGL